MKKHTRDTDYFPPDVLQDASQEEIRNLQRTAFLGFLRWAAETFRAMGRPDWQPLKFTERWEEVPPNGAVLKDGIVLHKPGERYKARIHTGKHATDQELMTACGEMLIDADAKKILEAPASVRKLLAWHTAPNKPMRRGQHAAYARCPQNLFSDLCGLRPRHRQIPSHERYAQTCEWLAQLVTPAAQPATPPTPRCRLEVIESTVIVDGKIQQFRLTDERLTAALYLLRDLIAHPSSRRSGPDIVRAAKADGIEIGGRLDRIFSDLPSPVRELIDSNTRGYQLRPTAWRN